MAAVLHDHHYADWQPDGRLLSADFAKVCEK